MSKDFGELKRRSDSGETFELIRGFMPFGYETHKRKRLERAGLKDSGTLLHRAIAKHHGDMLLREYARRADKIGRAASERFHLVTVLQNTTEPTIEEVQQVVDTLRAQYNYIFGGMKLWSRGAIELEIVNLDIQRKVSSGKEDEARKLHVLEALRKPASFQGPKVFEETNKSKVLVHCHSLVDFGRDTQANIEQAYRIREQHSFWKESGYQFQIKGLYSTQTLRKNLSEIAHYLTKGGNETLRFNVGFKRDLMEDEEAKMFKEWKETDPHNPEFDRFYDVRALSVGDVRNLDMLWRWLMNQRHDKRGYIIGSTDRR